MADNYRETLAKAEAGDEYSMECLGEFSFGNVIDGGPIEDFPKNPREGERWLNKLIAVTNDPQRKGSALHSLGIAYDEGVLFPRDARKAMEFYEQAADLGSAYSQSDRCRQRYDELIRYGAGRGSSSGGAGKFWALFAVSAFLSFTPIRIITIPAAIIFLIIAIKNR